MTDFQPAPPVDAATTESGLASVVLTPGTGAEHPDAADKVTVHYTGWTTDGKEFDSSHKRGRPATFRLDQVIAGWTEGVQLMKVGETRRLWIPEALAYQGQPGAPAGMLIFDVELLEIVASPKAPPAPEDVAGIPAEVETSESGLAWRVLSEGKGDESANSWDEVSVHYTGWTTDGKMFDSSIVRGEPATFPLDRVIAGWTEGVGMMQVGEKRRLWIPEELAYKGRPGAPAGMLVFDVELLDIRRRPEPPQAPADVAAVPADAEKSESGLAWKVLKQASGSASPGPKDIVEIDMEGWTPAGQLIDSTYANEERLSFPLENVALKGWAEGLALMSEGEKRRFWIPEELAFEGRPGTPRGMLVFDLELVKIH